MILRVLMTTTALAVVLAAGEPAVAQSQGGGNQQRWTQERAAGEGAQIRLSPAAIRLIQQALNQQGYDAGNLTGTWNNRTRQAARAYQAANNLEPTGTPTIALINAMGGFSVISGTYGEGQQQQGSSQRWTQETAAGEGVPLYASPAQVRLVQQALNSAGYDCGTVDGTWGSQTSQCAMAFQAANNLEPNGRLTVALISALGGNQAIFTAGPQTDQSGQRWTQETAAGPGTEIYASPATVRLVQQALNQAGYDAGSLDGNWSDRTVNAAQAYQAANNLEPTGSLTTALMASIGMPQWYAGQVLAFDPSAGQGSMQGGAGGQFGQGQQFRQQGQGQGRSGGGQQQFGQGQGQFGGGQQQFGQGQGRFGGGQQQFGQGQGRFGGGQQQFGQGQGRFGGGQQFGQGQGPFGGGQQFGQGQGQFGQGQGPFLGGGQQFGQGRQQFNQGQQFGQGRSGGQQFGGATGQAAGQAGMGSPQQRQEQPASQIQQDDEQEATGGQGGGQAGAPIQQESQGQGPQGSPQTSQ